MQLFFDSRLWKNNIEFSHFIQQIRKRNIVILGTTQYIDTLDKRIRQNSDVLIKPRFIKEVDECINSVFDITSLEDNDIPKKFKIKFNAKKIYSLYDTSEILT